MTATTIGNLDALCEALRNSPQHNMTDGSEIADYANAQGLPMQFGEIDWCALPTFGGEAPANLHDVWSWDATRMLVGTCAADLRIALRSDA